MSGHYSTGKQRLEYWPQLAPPNNNSTYYFIPLQIWLEDENTNITVIVGKCKLVIFLCNIQYVNIFGNCKLNPPRWGIEHA